MTKYPEKHLLKRIDKAVDFSFINNLLEDTCCKHFGRPAKEPEMVAKLLVMQYLYNLSDVRVMEVRVQDIGCEMKTKARASGFL